MPALGVCVAALLSSTILRIREADLGLDEAGQYRPSERQARVILVKPTRVASIAVWRVDASPMRRQPARAIAGLFGLRVCRADASTASTTSTVADPVAQS